MRGRIGIEISPSACRIVRIDRSGRGDDVETVVRAYAVTPAADDVTLTPYRGQHVAVVMWGLHVDHRQAVVMAGSYQRMRREAVNAAREAGVDTRQMLADIAPITAAKARGRRRPVVLALARTNDVAAALRTLTATGLRVRSLVTPALALMSLARLRRRLVAAGMAEAYVALEQTTTAITLLRDGALIAARELEWGYEDPQGQLRSRDEVTERLSAAIEEFLGDCGAAPSAVAQVCVCGGMPELRSMTVGLTQRLDIEGEPLDSLFGIDAERLPADDFRDRVVEMRLAWAAAADWKAPINLLRERRRRVAKAVLTRVAIVAGVATGVGLAWRIGRSALLEPSTSAPRPPAPASTPVRARPTPSAPVTHPAPPTPVVVEPPKTVVLTPVPEPSRRTPPRVPQTAAAPAVAVMAPTPVRQAPARKTPTEEVPLPFEASLGTILYGADRKLAIIDGHIVQVGDEVRGARVIEITLNSVLFRDRQGQLRRLSLENSRR